MYSKSNQKTRAGKSYTCHDWESKSRVFKLTVTNEIPLRFINIST